LLFLFATLYEYFDPEEANGADEKPAIDSINPQAGLSFDITNQSQLYFKVGQALEIPTLKELYSDRLGDYRPNPNLKKKRRCIILWDTLIHSLTHIPNQSF